MDGLTLDGLSPEQIADRRNYLGGTDAARILAGGEEWPLLWREKMGLEPPVDLSDNFAVQLGSYTEAFNRHWFERVTGRKVERVGELAQHPTIPYMRANLDGVTVQSKGYPAYIDFKHTGKLVLDRYVPQMTHNAVVLGLQHIILCAIVGNKWPGPQEFEVDPFFADELIAKEAEFWGYVEREEEPPMPVAVAPPKAKPLRTVILDDDDQTWPNWGVDMVEEFGRFERTHDAATVHAIAREAIKGLLPDDVGLCRHGRVSAKRDGRGVTITMEKTDG